MLLKTMLIRNKQLLAKKIVRQFEFDQLFSSTTFASDADVDSNEDILESLEDCRNETWGWLLRCCMEDWMASNKYYFYLTP